MPILGRAGRYGKEKSVLVSPVLKHILAMAANRYVGAGNDPWALNCSPEGRCAVIISQQAPNDVQPPNLMFGYPNIPNHFKSLQNSLNKFRHDLRSVLNGSFQKSGAWISTPK